MKMIGGNTQAVISVFETMTSDIGEQVKMWSNVKTVKGWLDMASGDSRLSSYDAKIQESTHIFICDYVQLPETVTSETARISIGGKHYAIQMIDDPMNLNEHLEIYLKYTGGQ